MCWLEFLAVAKDLFHGAYKMRGSEWVAEVEIQEDGTGRVFYFNKATGETSWCPFPKEDENAQSFTHQLRELMALRDSGDLTEEEFNAMKKALMGLSGVTGASMEKPSLEKCPGPEFAAATKIQSASRGQKIRRETSEILGEFRERRKTLVADLEVESGKGKSRLQQRLEERQKKKSVIDAKVKANARAEAMRKRRHRRGGARFGD